MLFRASFAIAAAVLVGCSTTSGRPAASSTARTAPTAVTSSGPEDVGSSEPTRASGGMDAACDLVAAAAVVNDPIEPMLAALTAKQTTEAFNQGNLMLKAVDGYLALYAARKAELPEGLALGFANEAREADYDIKAVLAWLFDEGGDPVEAEDALKDLNHLREDLNDRVTEEYFDVGGCP